MKKIFFAVIIVSLFAATASRAQSVSREVVVSGGDYFANDNATISWSLGETIVETFANESATVTQGFQQSLYLLTATVGKTDSHYKITVYPNPASEFIALSIDAERWQTYNLLVYDMTGRLVKKIETYTSNDKIPILDLGSSIYLLKVLANNKIVNEFKFIKIN